MYIILGYKHKKRIYNLKGKSKMNLPNYKGSQSERLFLYSVGQSMWPGVSMNSLNQHFNSLQEVAKSKFTLYSQDSL